MYVPVSGDYGSEVSETWAWEGVWAGRLRWAGCCSWSLKAKRIRTPHQRGSISSKREHLIKEGAPHQRRSISSKRGHLIKEGAANYSESQGLRGCVGKHGGTEGGLVGEGLVNPLVEAGVLFLDWES